MGLDMVPPWEASTHNPWGERVQSNAKKKEKRKKEEIYVDDGRSFPMQESNVLSFPRSHARGTHLKQAQPKKSETSKKSKNKMKSLLQLIE